MLLILIEAIAVARLKSSAAIGFAEWDARHDSSAFKFNRRFALTVFGGNSLGSGNESASE